jgi:hypothetical protein
MSVATEALGIGVTLLETVIPAGGAVEGYVVGLPASGQALRLRFSGRESVTRITMYQQAADLWQPRTDPVEHCTRHCDRCRSPSPKREQACMRASAWAVSTSKPEAVST